jgi:hypothetical protein
MISSKFNTLIDITIIPIITMMTMITIRTRTIGSVLEVDVSWA